MKITIVHTDGTTTKIDHASMWSTGDDGVLLVYMATGWGEDRYFPLANIKSWGETS